MSLHRFFLERQVLSNVSEGSFVLELSSSDLNHANVLRLVPGEHIAVVDAESDYFECQIQSLDRTECIVRITKRLGSPPSQYSITLFQGLAKGERFESVIRHASEFGIDEIYPLISSRSVVKLDDKRAAQKGVRWNSIAKSAAKQAGLIKIPNVESPVNVRDACAILPRFDLVIVCWEECDISSSIRCIFEDVLAVQGISVGIIVGPEGGLSDEEVSHFLQCNSNSHLASLGSTILRTETAGIVAVAFVVSELDWKFRDACASS